VTLHEPSQILLFAWDYNIDSPMLRVLVRIEYSNVSSRGQSAAVSREYIEITVGEERFYHESVAIVNVNYRRRNNIGCPSQESITKIRDKRQAQSLAGYPYEINDGIIFGCHSKERKLLLSNFEPRGRVIPAGSTKSYFALFEPRRMDCETRGAANDCEKTRSWLSWERFQNIMENHAEINISVGLELVSGKQVKHECILKHDGNTWHAFLARGWHIFDRFGQYLTCK